MSNFEPVQYYDAHCTNCGEVTKADRLAFDFGELINKAVTKETEMRLGANTKWEPILRLDLCFYYTWRDLMSIYHLRGGEYSPFELKVKHLRFQLQRFSKVTFAELVQKDINTREYNNLIRHVKYVNQQGQDVDFQRLASDIKEVVDLCSTRKSPNENEVIASFKVKVVMAKDDRGNEFAKKLDVLYEDGKRQTVINNVCPNCGKRFYSEVGKYEEIIIGMAGSARVGKTAYLAALVHSLIEKNNGIATVVEARNREWEFFKSTILEKFRNGEKIDKTAFEGNGETIPLFSIEINVLGKSYIFTFIDMPGEAFDNPDDTDEDSGVNFIVNERRIINHAEMMWFCVAPEQIDADIARIKKFTNAKQDEVNTKTATVMANIRATMEAVDMEQKMSAAILVTMSDQIMGEDAPEGLFLPDVDVCDEYIENGCLSYQKTNEFCELSKQYLDKSTEIVASLNRIFKRYSVFAVAAYGKNLQGSQDQHILFQNIAQNSSLMQNDFKPTPSMVELPFFWTLASLDKFHEIEYVPQYEVKGFIRKHNVYVGDKPVPVSEDKMFQQINRR